MVLMADTGVEWEDVFDVLAERQGMKSEKLAKWRAKEASQKAAEQDSQQGSQQISDKG